MANIITFRNFTQKCLWDNEISGQLSDGKWENSGVDEIFWTAKSKVGTPGVSFKTWKRANFNFASSDLIDIVGDRMLLVAKASKITTNEKIIGAAEYLEGIKSQEEFDKINDYREKYLKNFIKTWDEAEKIINANYSKSNLIADLKDMSKTVSLAGNTPTTSTGGNIPTKDMDRAKSIIDKAKGDKAKEIQYTTAMANSTSDKSKLQFRGDAMTKLGKDYLSKIFYNKLYESKVNKESDLKVGDKVKLDDYGKVREYKLIKKKYNGEFNLQSPGVINFDASPEWIIKNMITESKSIKVSNLIKLIESKTGKKIVLKEFISRAELKDIERFIDKLFSVLNIDIVFTNHFYERLNDLRNGKDIDSVELINLFKKFFKRYREKISLLPLEQETIIKDIESNLNLPFLLIYDNKKKEIDFIAKTIMRKDNFLGSNKKFIV